jgi:hypothetical protein
LDVPFAAPDGDDEEPDTGGRDTKERTNGRKEPGRAVAQWTPREPVQR